MTIRMADRRNAATSNGAHRLPEYAPDVHDQNHHWVVAGLLGFALFAGVAGIAALFAPHDVDAANAIRGTGLMVGALLTVGVSMWLNRKKPSPC